MADYHIGYTLGYRIEKIRDKPQIIHRMENQQIGIAQKSQRRFGSVYHRKRITTVRILFLSDEQQKIPDAVIRSRLPPHQLRNDRIHATAQSGRIYIGYVDNFHTCAFLKGYFTLNNMSAKIRRTKII